MIHQMAGEGNKIEKLYNPACKKRRHFYYATIPFILF